MERNVDIATGESVKFSYELAGLGSRFFAVVIDLTIQLSVLILAFLIVAWVSTAIPVTAKASSLTKVESAILTSLLVLALFVLFVGYFIIFEWRWNGRTPGKRLMGIRVVRDGGFPLDFTAAVVRNVVRILEAGLGFYAVSAGSTLLSPANRRLGDMAAGTLVVRDQRYERFASLPLGRESEERDDALVHELTPAERDLVRRYVERRPSLSLAARTEVAAQIAARIRPKLTVSFDHIDDDHLLVHLAATALA
jgi:uncharacterized RDD family membrane protein YckC